MATAVEFRERVAPSDEDVQPNEEELRVLFDSFDVAPRDGVLDFNEFRAAMTKMNGGEALQERFVRRAFDDVDADHNGGIDFEEFRNGFALLERMAGDTGARTMERVGSGISQTDPIFALASPLNDETAGLILRPPTMADTFAEEASTVGKLCLVTFSCFSFFALMALCLALFVLNFPFVYWYAASFEETCDHPVVYWHEGMIVFTSVRLLNGVLAICLLHPRHQHRFGALQQQVVSPVFLLWNSLVSLGMFAWIVRGGMTLYAIGGLFGDTSVSNCAADAPVAFQVLQSYFYLTFGTFGLLAFVGCTIGCIACTFGNRAFRLRNINLG